MIEVQSTMYIRSCVPQVKAGKGPRDGGLNTVQMAGFRRQTTGFSTEGSSNTCFHEPRLFVSTLPIYFVRRIRR